MMRRAAHVIGWIAVALAGCAPLETSSLGEPPKLPQPYMSPDAVVLEVATVRAPRTADGPDAADQLWDFVDEQAVPADVRRRLAANGLRCGLLGTQLPEPLRRALDAEQDDVGVRTESGRPLVGLSLRRQRLQCRAGRPAKIVAAARRGEDVAVLVRDGATVRGKTVRDAECVLLARVYPSGDGTARIELTPEIQHGPLKQRWVGHDGVWRVDAERSREVFDRLRVALRLGPGEMLVIGPASEPLGLGRLFFVDDVGAASPRRLLLMRLAQTQWDDLFAPEQTPGPIATPADE